MKCSNCGAEVAEGSIYCGMCGSRVRPQIIWEAQAVWSPASAETACPECGCRVEKDDVFCGNCGARIIPESEAAEPVNAPESEAAEPVNAPENGAAEPADAPESEAAEPVNAPESEAAEPADAPESEAAEPVNVPESEAAEPAGAPESEAAEPVNAPESGAAEPADAPKSKEAAAGRIHEPAASFYDREEDEKSGGRIRMIVVSAIFVLLAVLIGVCAALILRKPGKAKQTGVLYFQEESLYLADIRDRNDPVKITGRCVDGGIFPNEGLVTGDAVSMDGTFLFYREEYNGNDYDLYRMPVDRPEEREKIAVNVTSFQPLTDNSAVYMKYDSLYYFDGARSDRIGKNAAWYQVDENEEVILWEETDSRGGSRFCLRDLAGKKDPVELERDADVFLCNDGLTRFLSLKGEVLYLIDRKGEKERVAQDVEKVLSCDLDHDRIYYLTKNPVRLDYTDVAGDAAASDADRARVSRLGQMEIPYMHLCYHTERGDAVISERCWYSDRCGGGLLSEGGAFCLYEEGPRLEQIKADWEWFAGETPDEGFGGRLLDHLAETGEFSGMQLAVAERTEAEFDDIDGFSASCSVYYDGGDVLYLHVPGNAQSAGSLSRIRLSGRDAGSRTVLDDDVDQIENCVLLPEGIYYIKDMRASGGDLYGDGEEIAYDVHQIWKAGECVVYTVDYDEGTDGNADFTLAILAKGKKTDVCGDVVCADCAGDGTAVILADYDPEKGCADLFYFDGRDTRLLAEQVSGFVARNESISVR